MEENKPEVYKPDCSKMEYRYLGNTGLKVSVLGFGNWVNNMNDEMTKDECKAQQEYYNNELGVNLVKCK